MVVQCLLFFAAVSHFLFPSDRFLFFFFSRENESFSRGKDQNDPSIGKSQGENVRVSERVNGREVKDLHPENMESGYLTDESRHEPMPYRHNGQVIPIEFLHSKSAFV
jgi:hypothetical protein